MPPYNPRLDQGTPAITPYLNPDDPSLPAFTGEDARLYMEEMDLSTIR
jgi:hypothetical protein